MAKIRKELRGINGSFVGQERMGKRTDTVTKTDDRLEDETKAETKWIVTDGEL